MNPDLQRDERLSADTWADLEVARSFRLPGRRLELAFAAENVTDTRILDQCGLPQPGRLFRLQLRVF